MSLSNTATLSGSLPFYARIVFNLLKNCDKGLLTIYLPDNNSFQFGNGDQSQQATIRIIDHDFFKKGILYGDIGIGESYMDGDWETDSITDVIKWFILNIDNVPSISGSKSGFSLANLFVTANKWYHKTRKNSLSGSKRNIRAHYDLSNDFFRLFLDNSMTYSSALFRSENDSLEMAQQEKYERICRMVKLKATDHVLEIGSGWGGFSIYAAKKYGCKITTLTISEEQFNLVKTRVSDEQLIDQIDIQLKDYRQIKGSFDKIVSIEMLEAVGHKFLPIYFKKCHELLKKDGALALQVIVSPDARYKSFRTGVDWIQKHIFPGSLLPSIAAINKAVNDSGDLNLLDVKELGSSYAKTLRLWRQAFHQNLTEVRALGFDEAFIRKWNYYFSYCEAAFAMRNINVVQMVYTRPNNTKL